MGNHTIVTNLRRATVFLVLVSPFFYFALTVPMLYYDIGLVERPCRDVRTIELNGLTLFVGDIHTSGARSDSEKFQGLAEYVKTRAVSNVVVLGDLFRWRSDYDSLVPQLRDREEVIKWVLDILGLLGQGLTVYLVLGDTSHDPQDLNVNLEFDHTKFVSIGKCGMFQTHELTVIGLHGDQACEGPSGFAISVLASSMLLERAWKERMDIPSDTWVIMAHTHVPGIDYAAKVANTGGWTETPLIRAPTAMGIVVDEQGGVHLIAF